jgi:hypothetical protein
MPIILDDIDEPEVWNLVRWMTERSSDWVLIGGLMVATFEIEYGDPWRQTHDIDSLFDVRHAARGATPNSFYVSENGFGPPPRHQPESLVKVP